MATFKGSFHRVPLQKCMGMIGYSFSLKNTDWFGKEKVDIVVCDAYGQQPWYFRDTVIKAGETFEINRDTVGWDWAQGDFCALLDKRNRITQKWELQLKVYGPGECPDCHGTHKCRHCNGQGYPFDPRNPQVVPCPYCGGTGTCQTCDIPVRQPRYSPSAPMGQQGGGFPGGSSPQQRQQAYANLTQAISELQSKIQQVDWDMKMMQLRGTDVSSASVYRSYLSLKHGYERQLLDLQNKLQNL